MKNILGVGIDQLCDKEYIFVNCYLDVLVIIDKLL